MKPDIDAIMKGAGAAKPPEDDGHMMDLEECGEDVMDAMKAGDGKAFTAALKDFMDMCGKKEAPKE